MKSNSMKSGVVSFTILLFGGLFPAAMAQEPVTYMIDPLRVESHASDGIYGQFLEHIFNSVHGGLWGDLVLNGSLEPNDSGGGWLLKDGVLAGSGPITDKPVIFGDPGWTDYEFSVEARKVSGAEGFLVMFRVAPDGGHYWANLGGWGNKEHGFEKNRGPLGQHAKGTIESGRWYQVRIRCEGDRHQVWLDGEKVLDATDTAAPLRKGSVGLNSWNSQVEYRKARVTSLDGTQVLFQGGPPASAVAHAPAYWSFFGDAMFNSDSVNPYHERSSLRIRRDSDTGVAGIRQGPVALKTDDPLSGTLCVRGAAARGVSVRFVDHHGGVVCEKKVTRVGPEWTKETFRLVPVRNVDDAVIEVCAEGTCDLWVDDISVFPQSVVDHGGFRPDVLAAIMALHPANIRYPGGCFASAYRWKDAVGPQERRAYYPNVIWADRDPNQMGTDEFMSLCGRVGAEPILAINISLPVQETLDWIEYCNGDDKSRWGAERARNGHPKPYGVKCWEIDNETWGMGVERYAAAVSKFSKAMRAMDPSVKLIACGGYGYDDGQGSSHNWNRELIQRASNDFDYLSIHYYNGIMYQQDHVNDPRKYEAYIRDDLGALIRNSTNPKMRVYCSEWGMMNDRWSSGLYTGGLLNGFERQGGLLAMSCPAVWLQSITQSRPDPRWASCSVLFDHRQTIGAPTYVVEKLWRDHFASNVVRLDGPQKPLNVVASTTDDGGTLYLKLVNPEPKTVGVTLTVVPGWPVGKATMDLVNPGSAEARNTLAAQPVKVETATVTASSNGIKFTMPALSAGVVTVTKGSK